MKAVLVIPCHFQYPAQDSVPDHWELPRRSGPAPPNLTVMPVIELSPSPAGLRQITEAEAMPVANRSEHSHPAGGKRGDRGESD